jgi:threonine-phosphate decarboxylase
MTILSTTFPPSHGGQLRQVAARFGVQANQLFDFSANINPMGPPASAMSAIQRSLADPATITTYPDLGLIELKVAISSYLAVEHSQISVSNGFVPLLDSALRSLKLRCCLLPVPCFSEYRRTLERAEVKVAAFQLSSDRGFLYDPPALVQQCLDHGCDAVLLANPQNPSGVVFAAEQMKSLVEAATRENVTVLLDEAFIDYCPENSLAQFVNEDRRMLVFRSVTKFFAVPGLRVAYAVGPPSVAERLNCDLAPWPVTSFASDAVCAALCDDVYVERSRLANERQRLWMKQELARLDIMTYPSSANFLLMRFTERVQVDSVWKKMIADHHIVLRSCANFEGLADGHLRVAILSERENEILISALEQVLHELQ